MPVEDLTVLCAVRDRLMPFPFWCDSCLRKQTAS